MANINYSSIINELHQSGYYTSDDLLLLITTALSDSPVPPRDPLEHLVKTLLEDLQQREEEAQSRFPEPSIEECTQSHADDFAQQLHDKWTRGESLSMKEKEQLKNWYALQDNAESKVLATASEKTSATLQAQIDTALAGLVEVTKSIQETAAENKTLRGEIAALRRQLAHPPT